MNPSNIDEVFKEIGRINKTLYGVDTYLEDERLKKEMLEIEEEIINTRA